MKREQQLTHIIWVVVVLVLVCAIALIVYKEGFQDLPNVTAASAVNKQRVISYYRINDSLDYKQPSIDIMQIMAEQGNPKFSMAADYYKAEFLLFETLNYIDLNIKSVRYPRELAYLYGLAGSDDLASKSSLEINLRKGLSKQQHAKYMPKTYVLEDSMDMSLLYQEFNPNYVYITKKNIQRQEGNALTQDLNELLESNKSSVVAQVVLQDPLIINTRKINIRLYMLVVVDSANKASFHVYNNGFLYYTPKPFKKYSTAPDETITTGYIDRQVYVENPMTLEDLRVYMAQKHMDYRLLFINMLELMTAVAKVYAPMFRESNASVPGTKFLVYGCDIAPDSQLGVKLMEINKGPDLSYKDDRDRVVKFNMVKEALMIVGMIPRQTSNFHTLEI